jgi:phosphoribosylaminoimidazole-succinocarboxamide synthase
VQNHLESVAIESLPAIFQRQVDQLRGRTMLVVKTEVVPIECVVRGYLAGSGWKEYKESGKVCGVALPGGLQESQQLLEPIFTPSTKEEKGHDINISFEEMAARTGGDVAEELRERSIDLYRKAETHASERGIIIADTKFEWGKRADGSLIVIDEVLTPDSSRFWPRTHYAKGSSPPSFDKQFIRDWLQATGWDKNSSPPAAPPDVVAKTQDKYLEAYRQLTGHALDDA